MFGNIYAHKKVVVTGSTGFKGSWLCAWLLELGATVYGIAKDIPTQPANVEVCGLHQKMTFIQQDIVDKTATKTIIEQIQPDFVFHLAAQAIVSTSYQDPYDTFLTNTMGTASVLDALRGLKKPCYVVVITSDKCYDNVEWKWGYREFDALGGKDPYSASKSGAEMVFRGYFQSFFNKPESTIKMVSTRAGNVIGGGDWAQSRIVPDCFRAWSTQQAVEIRSPKATRPWQHVLEPLSGYLLAGKALMENPEVNGESYNFGPNADQDFTVLELLQALSQHWDFGIQTERFIIHEQPNFKEAGLLKLNCDKALFDMKWKPTLNFTQTAKFTATWYDHYYHQKADMLSFTLEQIRNYVQIAQEKEIAWTR